MPQVKSNGITLEYERSGPAEGAPLLLIHGVGAQLVRWPRSLCDALAAAGFHVIRFDNRDVGLSTHMDGAGVPNLAEVQAAAGRGDRPVLPYTLSDMAADAIGLLDALGIDQAHILGVSLGGMIAQVIAIEHSGRVRSLTIVMSQTGHSDLPVSDPVALAALSTPAPDPRENEEAYVAHSIALNTILGSPAYPVEDARLRDFALAAAARAYDPAGGARQLAAARGSPDRRAALCQLDVPTLVIHGADDPLIKLAGGEDIARHIPKAWLLTIHGMGHDLPDELSDILASAVAANARRTPDGDRTA
jgi:pimeloyl-ACP methyl ester carboxylesterase